MEPISLVVICGFLGSGKTTLLRRWKRDESLRDAAIIVQDLSDVGVDAELVSSEGNLPGIGEMKQRVAALHGRHALEELHGSMARTLDGITTLQPPASWVLVESTGAARPLPLLAAVTQNPQFHLRHFLVTVDALNLHRDFDDGAALTPSRLPSDPALQSLAGLLLEQASFANVIVLTKIDLVPPASRQRMIQCFQKLMPGAAVALSAQAGLTLEQLNAIAPPDVAHLLNQQPKITAQSEADSPTLGEVESEVFSSARPFHPQRLWECCQTQMGTGLYRTKGFLWLVSRPGHVLLWQQAGSQITLEFTGWWRAELALNREGKLQPEEVAYLKERVGKLDPLFGDRHIELVLIGRKPERLAFAKALLHCLCTDQEVAAWQRGEIFSDPWPQIRIK